MAATADAYDPIAAEYHTAMLEYFTPDLLRTECLTLPRLDTGFTGKLLDVGCSTGILTEYLHRSLPLARQITGLDGSAASIRLARQASPDGFCEYIQASLPLLAAVRDASQYDFVYSRYTLHYVEDVGAAFDSLAGMLRQHGRLFVKVCHPAYEMAASPDRRYGHGAAQFTVQAGNIHVRHPLHSVGDYVSGILAAGMRLDGMEERFSPRSEINGLTVPTQLLLHASKP